jgi:hypothetical protein
VSNVTTLGIEVESSGVRKATDDLENMAKSGKAAEMSASELEHAMARATAEGHVLGETITEGIKTVFEYTKQFVELGLAVGRYADLAISVGSSDPVGLATLRTAADIAGTSVESVVGSINRMALQLSRAEFGGQQNRAAVALKSIGLEIAEFRKLDGPEQFRALAVALNGYADTQQKVQVVQAITGRGDADRLVMLKELGKETEHHSLYTIEQIKAIKEQEDAMRKSRSEMLQTVEYIATGTIPALETVTKAANDFIKEIVGVGSEANKLKANNAVEDFAFGAAKALAFAVDQIDLFTRIFIASGKTIGASLAMTKEFYSGNFKASWDIAKDWEKDMTNIVNRGTFGDAVDKRIEELKAKRIAAAAAADAAWGGEGHDRSKREINFGGDAKGSNKKEEIDKELEALNKLQDEVLKLNMSAEDKRLFDFIELVTKAGKQEYIPAATEAMVQLRLAGVDKLIISMGEANQMIGKNAEQINLEKAALAGATEEQKKTIAYLGQMAEIRKMIASATEASLTPMEQYLEVLKKTDAAVAAGLETWDTVAVVRSHAFDVYEKSLPKAKKAIDEMDEFAKQASRNIQDSLGSTLEDMMGGHFENIGQMWGKMIEKMIAQALAAQLNHALFGDMGVSGGIGGWIGQLFGGSGKGMAGGGLGGAAGAGNDFGLGAGAAAEIPLATGGAAYGGSSYVVGEKGPELFVPTSSGTVVPNGQGGASVHMPVTVNIDSRADVAQVTQNVQAAIRESQKAMLNELRAQGSLR